MDNYIKIISLALICSLSLGVTAQEAPNKTDANGKKQGQWIKLDENKKKIYEGNFVDDKPSGKFSHYYDTGILKAVNVFSESGKVSRAKLYHPGGKLMAEGKYVDQKKDSTWKFYDEEEKLLSTENYINGVKNGVFKVYYRNGQVSEEKNWKSGQMDGSSKKYFETGQIKYTGQYIKDKVEGKVTFYHSTGKVDAEGIYKGDLKDGAWKYYKEDGTLLRTDTYVNGRLTSPDPNIIPKEQSDKEKQKFEEQKEVKDPFQGN